MQISDSELLSATKSVADAEKSLTLKLLEHLVEIDQRKLFATLGYDSLYKYVAKELGYSEGSAYERLRAMQLLKKLPQVREKLANGGLTLTTAAQVESFCRREALDLNTTVQLVKEIEGKSKREVEIHLLSKTPQAIPEERIRQITPEHQEVKIILDPELQQLLKRYSESHKKENISEILKNLLKGHFRREDFAVAAKQRAITLKRSRYIPRATRQQLKRRAQGQCEWKNPASGVRCSSRYRLQADHYPKPYALGGSHELKNLRLVCAAHNLRSGIETGLILPGHLKFRKPNLVS